MIAIAPTDFDWFSMLKSEMIPELVNFWTPTPWNIRRLKKGDKFYFLLKSPHRRIAGYGSFNYYKNMPAKEAWDTFGLGNGVNNLKELIERASKYALKNAHSYIPSSNPEIGCVVLSDLVFFDEDKYLSPNDVGLDFAPEIVKFKYFDIDSIKIITESQPPTPFIIVQEGSEKYKKVNTKDRKGQPDFRRFVFNTYNSTCCITGETCLEIIQAAHIQPYINEDSNHIQNGIPLRIDIHKLFDAGLITIDKNYIIRLSPYLFSSNYLVYDGKKISLPADPAQFPSKEALNFHNKVIFRG